ncbi:tetratricopeptide repeat protein [Brumimicrobium mesophilum]|uniref:tetratricopeptide repeat protein n=1 Tax=Brumimicrobium mesophilum TaxID=392717 RepID=UPI000D13EF5A|nr:tetratricopeptide repeat protein [Brumimicrobium mesophilum]
MRKLLFISSLVLFPLAPLFGQGEKEKSMQEQAMDDINALSSRDYPYIEQFHQAIREKISGNYSEAKKRFNACLEIKQDDDAVYFGLAEIAKVENNFSAALENFQKAYDLDPSNLTYLQELAYIHFERANFEQAEILFKEMCEREPRNLDFRYGYSKVLIYNKAYQLAIDELNTLQSQTGVVPELMIMKADLYVEIKNYDKAEETLLILKEEYPKNKEVLGNIIAFYEQRGEKKKAINLIEQLAQNDPDNGMAQFVLANNLIEQENYKEFLELAPELLKNNQIEIKQKLFIFKKIQDLKQAGDPMIFDASEELYKSYPEDFEIASRYVKALITSNQSKKAVSVARKATVDNPNNFEAWKLAFAVESNYMDYPALYEDGNKALALFPTLPVIYFATAEGALYSNNPEEAIQLLAAGEIYLLDDKKKESLFSMRKGEIYFHNKEYKKGIVAFEKAMINNADDQSIQIAYALALSKAKIADEVANEILNKITESNQTRDYFLAKAIMASNSQKYSAGIEILEIGIKKELYKAELLDLLGDLHFQNQSLNKALEAWKAAQKSESRNQNLIKKINEEKLYAPKYY